MTSIAAGHEAHTEEVSWRDGKRYAWLLGLVVPSIPFIIWGVYAASNGSWVTHAAWWLAPIIVFVLIPVLDMALGNDAENPPEELVKWLEQDRYYQWILYLFLPVQYAGLVLACWMWTTFDMTVVDKIGLAISVGVVAGIGINTAHELGHKKEKHERWLSKIALAQTFYGHFFIEHNRGHHVRVATPEDPASSRFGESFWRFLPRSIAGSLTSAWGLERKRLARMNKGPWTLRNDVLNAWAMSAALFGALVIAFGPGILPLLVIQAIFGFSLLEVVNYLEHYGLLRQRAESGRYERPAARHSWNSNNVVTNVFLYHLQRHSDHHANPTRRYQALRDFDEAPQLPAGYASMIVLAWIPPLWRKVMDKRVLDHYDGDITKANIQPSKREKILARYGATA
ncbi:fatty acid desaturase [Haloechinothrix salitolerans]